MKTVTLREVVTDKQMLDFVIEMMAWPSLLKVCAASTGDPNKAFYCQFGAEDASSLKKGTVYAATARGALQKAMRLHNAQVKACELIESANREQSQ